jgi:hypothetical protein
MLWESCISSYAEHKKLGLQFFDFSTILYEFYKLLLKHSTGQETILLEDPRKDLEVHS